MPDDVYETPADPGQAADAPPTDSADARTIALLQFTPCTACGYDLRGLHSDGLCPECATPIGLALPDVPFVKPPERPFRVESEITCVRCGSSLQSLTTDNLCPHCGAPVWFSIHGTWLRASDPAWLKRVRSGFVLWLWAIGATLLLSLIGAALGAAWGLTWAFKNAGGGTGATTANIKSHISELQQSAWLYAVPMIIPLIMKVFIAYRVSTPEPRTRMQDPQRRRRKVVRFLGVSTSIAMLVALVLNKIQPPPWILGVAGLTNLLGVALTVVLLIYIRDFARRIPKPALVRSASIVLWGWGLALAVQQLAGSVYVLLFDPNKLLQSPVTPPTMPAPAVMMMGIVSCTNGLALSVFGIWLIVVIVQIVKALSTALSQAGRDMAIDRN